MREVRPKRVAIVHYWLLGMRGGEKVVEALCRMYPAADIFTLFYAPESVSDVIRSHRVTTSFLNRGRRIYRSLLPVMPIALEQFDLRDYDLVISSESGPAKGVVTRASTRHVCYCHTPMRYLWDLYPDYVHDFVRSRLQRALIAPVANYLRLWDYSTAARVDDFAANSENTRQRIWRAYRREAQVIYPPVATDSFYHRPAEDYFLMVSELVPYKRLDYAVRVFARTGRKLRVAGDGPELKHLRKAAGGAVEFLGRVTDEELRELYARCRAFVLPGEEDFGITMVEALASGKPVIALGQGGALEVVPERGGVLYAEPREESLENALIHFDRVEANVDAASLALYAKRFSEERFAEDFDALVAIAGSRFGSQLASGTRDEWIG